MNVERSFLLSGIFLSVLCPITVLANSFLLLAIYKDPLKTFHGPTACLISPRFIDHRSHLGTCHRAIGYYVLFSFVQRSPQQQDFGNHGCGDCNPHQRIFFHRLGVQFGAVHSSCPPT